LSPLSVFSDHAGAFDGAFNRSHFSFHHDLVGNPLFELGRLADLSKTVNASTRDNLNQYVLLKDAESVPNASKQWENFKSPDRVHDSILNIRDSKAWVFITGADIDPDYRNLLDEMLAGAEAVCGQPIRSEIIWSTLSILIGSPNSVTNFHIDTESNFLFQIHGNKEAHLFDQNDRTVLREEDIEALVTTGRSDIPYDPAFEASASVYDLSAGTGVHIPPYAPHWVRNLSDYSITATALFYTRSATERAWIHQCNYLMRKAGLRPSSPGATPWVDDVKSGLLSQLSTKRPVDKGDILRSGVRRLTAPARLLGAKVR